MDKLRILEWLDVITDAIGDIREELSETTSPIHVNPGEDLNAIIKSINATGGTILLEPGAIYKCNIVLEARDVSKTIYIKSFLETKGRVKKSDIAYMPVLASPNIESTVKAKYNSGGIVFKNIAFGPITPDRTQIDLGGDKNELTAPEQRAREFTFQGCLFLGSLLDGQHRGVQCNALRVRVFDCAFYDFFEMNRDSQAVCGWNGTEQVWMENCFFEASGENVIFGGSDSASAAMIPKSITIIGCKFSKNIEWMKLPRGSEINIKALFEIKDVIDFYMAGCLLENNWAKDWPSGVGMTLKVANGDGGEPWATMQNVLIENNVIRKVGSPFTIVGQNDGKAGRITTRGDGVVIRNNLAYSINKAPYYGDAHAMPINNPPHNLTVQNNTILGASYNMMNLWFGNGVTEKAKGFKYLNNVIHHGTYGIASSVGEGILALNAHFDNPQMANNVIRRDPARTNKFPLTNTVMLEADFDACLDAGLVFTSKVDDGIKRGIDMNKILSALRDPL